MVRFRKSVDARGLCRMISFRPTGRGGEMHGKNTQRYHRASIAGAVAAAAACLAIPLAVHAAPVTFQNATTRLTVNGGEANNGLVPSGGYFDYFDIARNETTTWSIDPVLVFPSGTPKTVVLSNGSAGGFGSPTNLGNGIARSTGAGRGINVQADTQLVGPIARTTFTFTSTAPMDGVTFVFYAEDDLFSAANDSATFTGSIAQNNLALFQFDSATSDFFVKLTAHDATNAALTSFASGVWTGFGTSLEAGDLSVLAPDGSKFATTGDLGRALAFNLSGTTAGVTVDYQSVAEVPEPATCATVTLAAIAFNRRRRAR
jgi:hypothetical protein